MLSLDDLALEGLIYSIKNEKDTTKLIEWLYGGGNITPELGALIADILIGKLKASPKKIKKTSIKRRAAVEAELNYHKENLTEFNKHSLEKPREKPIINLGDDLSLSWSDMEESLKRAGYYGATDTKGYITMAAKHLTTHSRRLSISQLDEILIKRKRKK